jgi:hypothetical protein
MKKVILFLLMLKFDKEITEILNLILSSIFDYYREPEFKLNA